MARDNLKVKSWKLKVESGVMLENLLECRALAGFTGCGGEMAEWLKAMVC
jgi:hypothetical protein